MAAIFGCAGLASVLIWPFLNCHRHVILVQVLGAISFALYFGFEGALLASASCLISSGQLAARGLCANKLSIAPVFGASLAALLGLAIFGHGGTLAYLAIAGSCFGTLARLQTSTVRMKAFFLAAAPLWFLHNLLLGAYLAILVDVVSMLTNGITLAKTLETMGLAAPVARSPAPRFTFVPASISV